MNRYRAADPALVATVPALYMAMIETAEIVAERYGVSREAQDEYALQSQQRTAAAQSAGAFEAEIAPLASVMSVTDKATGETSKRDVRLTSDEGNRPQTTLADLSGLKPVFKGRAAGQGRPLQSPPAMPSQLSDGASASVLMEPRERNGRGLTPLGAYRGIAVAAAIRTRWASARSSPIPKLLKQHGLTIDDIGIWELNEAFASQALYCRDKLGIPNDRLNVSGGAISIGHPYGMSGARMTGHVLIEGKRPRGEIRHRDHVRRRRHGCRRAVRDLLTHDSSHPCRHPRDKPGHDDSFERGRNTHAMQPARAKRPITLWTKLFYGFGSVAYGVKDQASSICCCSTTIRSCICRPSRSVSRC
ncbi:MAG: hypothetical protein WDN69_31700 [Aliidongia sp.]